MSLGCSVNSSSAFPLHKTMNNELFPSSNPNPNPPIQRQIDIVSLLGCDTASITTHHSIKRTLSADMSSPKWLQYNGFSSPSMKRAQSSDRLNNVVVEEELNKQKFINEDEKKGAFEDIWSSILSKKGSGSGSGSGSGQLPPPYVHPMVKRTTSSLSEKSLEICTESLGSETGSDGFSFPVSSEPEDTDKDLETTEDQHVKGTLFSGADIDEVSELGDVGFVKGSVSPTLSPSPSSGLKLRSSFPPPLPSLANRNGSNVHMRSHRQDGRLVVEAVAVPSQNCFKAHRRDGRLLLTLSSDDDDDDDDDVELCNDHLEQEEYASEVNDDDELEDIECGEEYQEDEGKEVIDKVVEDGGLCFPIEMVNVKQATTPALIMSGKFKWLNSTTPRNDNVIVTNGRAEVDQHKSMLPPRPKMARVISKDGQVTTATATNSVLNVYEYYWRQSATAMAVLKPLAGQHTAPQVVEKEGNYMTKLLLGHNNEKSKYYSKGQEKQEVVVVKAIGTRAKKGDQREKEGEYLVPLLRGCKEPKRSFLLWVPHCIATS